MLAVLCVRHTSAGAAGAAVSSVGGKADAGAAESAAAAEFAAADEALKACGPCDKDGLLRISMA